MRSSEAARADIGVAVGALPDRLTLIAVSALPATVDRTHYEHNYQAARVYHIGVYHRPHGWVEVPPVGFEWVRDDTDAILVNVSTGQILQVEYGVFG
jgi:hypothetical protein